MSETLHHQAPENLRPGERVNEHQENTVEKKVEQPIHESQSENQKRLEYIRKRIEKESKDSEQVEPREKPDKSHSPTNQPFVNKELKEMAYRRTLNRVRQQMSIPDRLVSRVIHNPAVNALSEATSKTVGRPSGLLGGGFLSLAGTLAYYYVTKHYGYNYNYLIFLLLMAGGFIIGWLIEALWYLFSSRRKTP
jgi:hypothetical protein